jgi:hypothetical protein
MYIILMVRDVLVGINFFVHRFITAQQRKRAATTALTSANSHALYCTAAAATVS